MKSIGVVGSVIVLVVVAGFFLLLRELKETRHDLLEEQTRGYNSVIRHADSTAQVHKDSVLIIERKVSDVTANARTAIVAVRNTRDVDSLILLYWLHRASTGSRFIDSRD